MNSAQPFNSDEYVDSLRSRGINVIDYSLHAKTDHSMVTDCYFRLVVELSKSQMQIVTSNTRFTTIEQHLDNACQLAKLNGSVAPGAYEGQIEMHGNQISIMSLTNIIDLFLARILKQ